MKVSCKECGTEFTNEANDYPGKVFEHEGEAICENCLIGMGVLPDHSREDHPRLMMDAAWYYVRPY